MRTIGLGDKMVVQIASFHCTSLHMPRSYAVKYQGKAFAYQELMPNIDATELWKSCIFRLIPFPFRFPFELVLYHVFNVLPSTGGGHLTARWLHRRWRGILSLYILTAVRMVVLLPKTRRASSVAAAIMRTSWWAETVFLLYSSVAISEKNLLCAWCWCMLPISEKRKRHCVVLTNNLKRLSRMKNWMFCALSSVVKVYSVASVYDFYLFTRPWSWSSCRTYRSVTNTCYGLVWPAGPLPLLGLTAGRNQLIRFIFLTEANLIY